MKRVYACLSLLLVPLFLACEKESEVWLKSREPVLVLNAGLNPADEITAYLGKTIGTGDKFADFELQTSGTISVYVDNVFKGQMTYFEANSLFDGSKGKYILSGIKPLAGEEIKLFAEVQGFEPVTASVKIPSLPELLSVDTVRYLANSWEQEWIRIYMKLKDQDGTRDYYRVMIDMRDETENGRDDSITYYGGSGVWVNYEDPVFTADLPLQSVGTTTQSKYGIFTDNLFKGKEYVLKFSIAYSSYVYPPQQHPEKSLYYNVRLLSLSDSYYAYFKQNGKLSFSIGNIGLTSSIDYYSSYSNVKNGFGLVYAYNEVRRMIGVENPD